MMGFDQSSICLAAVQKGTLPNVEGTAKTGTMTDTLTSCPLITSQQLSRRLASSLVMLDFPMPLTPQTAITKCGPVWKVSLDSAAWQIV